MFCAVAFSLFAGERFAAVDTIALRKIPYLIVSPQEPVLTDSVTLRVMIATASNSCMAPQFSDCSFTVHRLPETDSPEFLVAIKFTAIRRDDIVCPAVYNPVDYGPAHNLGKLEKGIYYVVDGNPSSVDTQAIYGRFEVKESSAVPIYYCTIKGSVHDDPLPLKRAGMPVAGATVYLRSIEINLAAKSADRIIAVYPDSAVTDESGNYAFTDVRPGIYQMTCSHPDYRTKSMTVAVRNDTAVNFILVPASAGGTITGMVSLITSDAAKPVPVERCTISVSSVDPSNTAISSPISSIRLVSVTDVDGLYTIGDIPITENGEIWYVQAFYGTYSAIDRVQLYNTRTDTADFTFSASYANEDSVTFNGCVFKTATDKFTYQSTEPVKVRYSVTNTVKSNMSFGPFPVGCEYDLVVAMVLSGGTREVYRASMVPGCGETDHEIVVDPGVTVVKNFPDWYLSDMRKMTSEESPIAANYFTLSVTAQLRGELYDGTAAGVQVRMELGPLVSVDNTVKTATASAAAYNAVSGRLTMNLARAQRVTVACFTPAGREIRGSRMMRYLEAGTHLLTVNHGTLGRGLYIVAVKGDGFTRRFTSLYTGK